MWSRLFCWLLRSWLRLSFGRIRLLCQLFVSLLGRLRGVVATIVVGFTIVATIVIAVVSLRGILLVVSLGAVLLVSALWREWGRNVLLWDGEANLLALITLLVVELWQRVLVSLFAGFTMAEGIECQEDGMAERDGICLVVACHIVAWGGVAGGCIAILKEWIAKGWSQPSDEIAEKTERCLFLLMPERKQL